MVDHFQRYHVWGEPNARCTVVDAQSCEYPVQAYMEPERTPDRVWGSCTSVCLLVVVCCLRFRCWDLQRMCDVVRACMQQLDAQERTTFVLRLYCWHRTFDPGYPDGTDQAGGGTIR